MTLCRDAPSAARSNLLRPPQAPLLAASPTSPFASELSSPRISLPANAAASPSQLQQHLEEAAAAARGGHQVRDSTKLFYFEEAN